MRGGGRRKLLVGDKCIDNTKLSDRDVNDNQILSVNLSNYPSDDVVENLKLVA